MYTDQYTAEQRDIHKNGKLMLEVARALTDRRKNPAKAKPVEVDAFVAAIPTMITLIRDLLAYEALNFADDSDVLAADLVDHYAAWRRRAFLELKESGILTGLHVELAKERGDACDEENDYAAYRARD
jgi:hypothetical protein